MHKNKRYLSSNCSLLTDQSKFNQSSVICFNIVRNIKHETESKLILKWHSSVFVNVATEWNPFVPREKARQVSIIKRQNNLGFPFIVLQNIFNLTLEFQENKRPLQCLKLVNIFWEIFISIHRCTRVENPWPWGVGNCERGPKVKNISVKNR